MTKDTEKKISALTDKEVLALTRMTEADKWVSSSWRSIPAILACLILFLIPAGAHFGYFLGTDAWWSWPDNAGVLKYISMIGYIGIAIAFSIHMRKLGRAMEDRLDEVERHIEYRATAIAGSEAVWYGVLAWGFALWFPQFYLGIMAALPLLIFCSFHFAYFGERMKLRHELKA